MERSPLDERRRRARAALGMVAAVLAGLGLGFFQTQVARSPDHAPREAGSRPRAIAMPAPRGLILDREGRVLAESVPTYVLSMLPGPTDSVRAALQRLAPYLDLPAPEIPRLMEAQARAPHAMLEVSDDVPLAAMSKIEHRRSLFPGLVIEVRPRRRYPGGAAAAHLVGYVEQSRGAGGPSGHPAGHGASGLTGRAGIEAEYEGVLAGRGGFRYVEVDRHGRLVGALASPPVVSPLGGEKLDLSVDLTLQGLLAEAFPSTVRAGVAMIEPAAGAVVALYSSPSYDPNTLTVPTGAERLAVLRADSAGPLRDRAMGTTYATGPVWQATTAALTLELGIVSGESLMPLACRGGMPYGGRYLRCDDPAGHGALTLVGALRSGCAVYFHQLGLQVGLERLMADGARTGFGRRTGIDLPGEPAGGIRLGRAGSADSAPGERAARLAAGQAPTEASPLQLAHHFAALMTPGGVPSPRVRRTAGPSAAYIGVLDPGLSPATRATLRESLRRSPARDEAFPDALPEDWEWLGTGGRVGGTSGPYHTWFVGLAGPRDGAPELAVAVVIEDGFPDPAEIAARAVDHHLRTGHASGEDVRESRGDDLIVR